MNITPKLHASSNTIQFDHIHVGYLGIRRQSIFKVTIPHMQQVMTDTIMSDLHQSPAWISKYDNNGPFQGDPHGISLALCTDGMNPFSEHSTTYSMWPITLTILNLLWSADVDKIEDRCRCRCGSRCPCRCPAVKIDVRVGLPRLMSTVGKRSSMSKIDVDVQLRSLVLRP